jgi:predicted nuclease of predicted toxin-antitoxin system
VKLFIDECLSPQLAKRLNETGRYDAVHVGSSQNRI